MQSEKKCYKNDGSAAYCCLTCGHFMCYQCKKEDIRSHKIIDINEYNDFSSQVADDISLARTVFLCKQLQTKINTALDSFISRYSDSSARILESLQLLFNSKEEASQYYHNVLQLFPQTVSEASIQESLMKSEKYIEDVTNLASSKIPAIIIGSKTTISFLCEEQSKYQFNHEYIQSTYGCVSPLLSLLNSSSTIVSNSMSQAIEKLKNSKGTLEGLALLDCDITKDEISLMAPLIARDTSIVLCMRIIR